MRAGELRHRVQFSMSQPGDANEYGERTTVEQVRINAWANVTPISGSLALQSGQPSADVTHTISMRYRDSMRPGMTIDHGSRRYHVVSAIDPTGRKQELQILCREAA